MACFVNLSQCNSGLAKRHLLKEKTIILDLTANCQMHAVSHCSYEEGIYIVVFKEQYPKMVDKF